MSSKDEVFLGMCALLGQLGTCDRAHVGALIVREGRCISWGYNGAPPGMPHCSENMHGWLSEPLPCPDHPQAGKHRSGDSPWMCSHCGRSIDWPEEDARMCVEARGCRNATHAEANALAFAARQGISTDGATLYVSISPCETCARLLIAAGIVRVVALSEYRDQAGVELLRTAGVTLV